MKRNFARLLPVLLIGFTLTVGCGKKMVKEDISGAGGEQGGKPAEVVPDEKPATSEAPVQSADASSKPAPGAAYASLPNNPELTKQAEQDATLYAVHFDFDKYNIKDQDKPSLETDAKWLNLNKSVKITIEGHADERGETEYNLALGDKRARSVKKYLETLGVAGSRMTTISYGEEKPVDPGHNEAAWAKNRRAEFRITAR